MLGKKLAAGRQARKLNHLLGSHAATAPEDTKEFLTH